MSHLTCSSGRFLVVSRLINILSRYMIALILGESLPGGQRISVLYHSEPEISLLSHPLPDFVLEVLVV